VALRRSRFTVHCYINDSLLILCFGICSAEHLNIARSLVETAESKLS